MNVCQVHKKGCTRRGAWTGGRGARYYLLHLPATTPLVDLVALARSRWPIEQQYRELKDDLGLDHFEGRTYQGWTHHVVLTAVAFTFLQIERARATDGPRPTIPVDSSWIGSVTYAADATLTVRFRRGTVYRYFTVPRAIFEAFLTAASKG